MGGPAWYRDALAEILHAGRDYGSGSAAQRERVQVEMVSANPTGPITVASARNGAYGDSVARLLAFAGDEVAREYYYNDAGAQMERFRVGGRRARGAEVPEDGYHGAYITEVAQLDDPVGEMLKRIEESHRALPDPLRLVGAAERPSGGCRRSCLGWTRTRRTVRSGRARPRTATTTTAC